MHLVEESKDPRKVMLKLFKPPKATNFEIRNYKLGCLYSKLQTMPDKKNKGMIRKVKKMMKDYKNIKEENFAIKPETLKNTLIRIKNSSKEDTIREQSPEWKVFRKPIKVFKGIKPFLKTDKSPSERRRTKHKIVESYSLDGYAIKESFTEDKMMPDFRKTLSKNFKYFPMKNEREKLLKEVFYDNRALSSFMNETQDGFDIAGLTFQTLTKNTRDEYKNQRKNRKNLAKKSILKEEELKNQRAISCYPKHSRFKLKEYYHNIHRVRLDQREIDRALEPISHNFEKLEETQKKLRAQTSDGTTLRDMHKRFEEVNSYIQQSLSFRARNDINQINELKVKKLEGRRLQCLREKIDRQKVIDDRLDRKIQGMTKTGQMLRQRKSTTKRWRRVNIVKNFEKTLFKSQNIVMNKTIG